MLALEAFDLAARGRIDVLGLFAGDGDLVPLVRKLNTTGVRTLLFGWDLTYSHEGGPGTPKQKEIRTAQSLIQVSTYPVMMPAIIDDRSRREDALVNGMFGRPSSAPPRAA
jgi:uncharacterized LabA/DUF88 family protein